jgi:nucleotide-binding universal stress UspA family protein
MFARATDAAVAILGVIDTSAGFAFGAEGAAVYERSRAETQAAIEAASTVVRGAGVAHVEHLIMDGTPHEAILAVADEQGADLIVMIGSDRAMLPDRSLGKSADYLIRHARCPILFVPAERMLQ